MCPVRYLSVKEPLRNLFGLEFIPNPSGKFVVANLLLLSLRAKRGNLFSPQDKRREAISHRRIEIATHLSGARNDACINRLSEFARLCDYIFST